MMNRNFIRFGLMLLGLVLLNVIVSRDSGRKQEFLSTVGKMKAASQMATMNFAPSEAVAAEPSGNAIVLIGASQRLTFNELRQYRFSRRTKNPVPKNLLDAQGKEVDIAGYMIPLNEALDVTEFMLIQVPFFGCCFSVPPEPNETVMVTMQKGKKTEYVYTPIRVRGKFQVSESKIDDFITSVYKIEATAVSAASADDKDVVKHQAGSAPPSGY
ncbi:MAG: DUF3299 domain-containing protein [Rhizobacter sp.]|nr:DUF3299 domain-containing protein [Chlorobiales bacterium]